MDLRLALRRYFTGKCFGIGQGAFDEVLRPAEMASGAGDGVGLAVEIGYLPDRDALPEHVSFAATGGIAKAYAGEFLFECFFLEIEAAQAGDLEVAAFGLAGEEVGVLFFETAGLDDGRHERRVVYIVDGVKPARRLNLVPRPSESAGARTAIEVLGLRNGFP